MIYSPSAAYLGSRIEKRQYVFIAHSAVYHCVNGILAHSDSVSVTAAGNLETVFAVVAVWLKNTESAWKP